LLLLDGQVHHDTHALPMGNYVIAVGNYVIVSPSELGNCVIADTQLPRAYPHEALYGGKILVDLATGTMRSKIPDLSGSAGGVGAENLIRPGGSHHGRWRRKLPGSGFRGPWLVLPRSSYLLEHGGRLCC
jgi:hypothetical protein